jgi:hypothetical protein
MAKMEAIETALHHARYYAFYHATKTVSQQFLEVLELMGKAFGEEERKYIRKQAAAVRMAYK